MRTLEIDIILLLGLEAVLALFILACYGVRRLLKQHSAPNAPPTEQNLTDLDFHVTKTELDLNAVVQQDYLDDFLTSESSISVPEPHRGKDSAASSESATISDGASAPTSHSYRMLDEALIYNSGTETSERLSSNLKGKGKVLEHDENPEAGDGSEDLLMMQCSGGLELLQEEDAKRGKSSTDFASGVNGSTHKQVPEESLCLKPGQDGTNLLIYADMSSRVCNIVAELSHAFEISRNARLDHTEFPRGNVNVRDINEASNAINESEMYHDTTSNPEAIHSQKLKEAKSIVNLDEGPSREVGQRAADPSQA